MKSNPFPKALPVSLLFKDTVNIQLFLRFQMFYIPFISVPATKIPKQRDFDRVPYFPGQGGGTARKGKRCLPSLQTKMDELQWNGILY